MASSDEMEETANKNLHLTVFDVFCTGITIVISGFYYGWNQGLESGTGSFLISTILIGLAYICLSFCNAEITSALPFAGGCYGLGRATLGFYVGYIVGCSEASGCIFYSALFAYSTASTTIAITNTSDDMLLLYCLGFYISALAIQFFGGHLYWKCNRILSVCSLGFNLIFIFGSIPLYNFTLNAPSPSVSGGLKSEYFVGGFQLAFSNMPVSMWWYIGIESLNLVVAFVEKVRESLIIMILHSMKMTVFFYLLVFNIPYICVVFNLPWLVLKSKMVFFSLHSILIINYSAKGYDRTRLISMHVHSVYH